MLLIHSRDVELNARPKKLSFLFFFHWNINGNETLDILDSSTEANDPKLIFLVIIHRNLIVHQTQKELVFTCCFKKNIYLI